MYINLLGIAIGMKYLHSQKTVQRDLKPLNILLDENYYPRISDFSFSKKLDKFNSSNLMSSGVGTIIYMAPEILTGSPYNYKVDVYAYSIIAYELLTSKSPISEGENSMSFVTKVPNGKRPDISMLKDQDQIELLKKCWSGDPSERPTFSQIVDLLKDKKFYSKFDVDEDEINDYLELFDNLEEPKKKEEQKQTKPKKEEPLNIQKKKFDNKTKMKSQPNDLKSESIVLDYDTEPSFKVVLIGDNCTRKTKIVSDLLNDDFDSDNTPLAVASYTNKLISTPTGRCSLMIWDTAGQERFRSLSAIYYIDCSAVIITANANIEGQIDSLKNWFNEASNNVSLSDTLIVVAITYSVNEKLVDKEKLIDFARENNLNFFEVLFESSDSSKKMFTDVASILMENYRNKPKQTKSEMTPNYDYNVKKSCLIY